MAIVDELTVLDAPVCVDVLEGLRLVCGEILWRHLPKRAWIFGAVPKPALEVIAVEESSEAFRSLVLSQCTAEEGGTDEYGS